MNAHKNQKDALVHTLKSIKVKSAEGNRYSSNWLLECLLLRIKSPAAYRHLREAKMLPLPCGSTLQRLIAHEKCKFGFSSSSLTAIKRQMDDKTLRDRQGSLIFDELKLRESLDYNRQSHRIDGFVNYGEENEEIIMQDKDKFANHALVMMFRPMNASWVQPIAAFATRNAAKGDHLAKLVLQAIVKLESVGAQVLNIVCDGAKPNKRMWKCFGISGISETINNNISHPCDEDRLLYFSSDVPHPFKCIRNHFLNRGIVRFQGKQANFQHYEKLYLKESTLSPGLRVCPKLTSSHINPNNFEKMVVSYATQLFSKHVGNGLNFYMNNPSTSEEFYDVDGTIQLTLMLNDLFDPLNAKIPSQGLRLNSDAFLKLKMFMEVINDEYKQRSQDKKYIPFASDETLAGLRVTVQSTIDIVEYLITKLGFAYVLPVKFNQDALENFFGLIRAAGGHEEHPTIKNFLHLHRLLSMYNPCKRIIRGNIRTDTDDTILCSFRTSLRDSAARVELEQKKIDDEIRRHINDLVSSLESQKTAWNNSLADHNYSIYPIPTFSNSSRSNSSVIDKVVVFQLCGYVAYKFRKLSNCEECYKSLHVFDSSQTVQEFATLVDMYNKGPLHYPSVALFQFVVHGLEPSICSMIECSSFFGDMLIECIQNMPHFDIGNLGCSKEGHRIALICMLIPFYINMRYDFWCRSMKDKIGKGKCTRAKRKESKLV